MSVATQNIFPHPYHPQEVKTVVWLYYIGAVLSLISGFITAARLAAWGLGGGGAIVGGIIGALISFGVGYYFNNYRVPLAYWIALGLAALGALLSLLSLFTGGIMSLISLAIEAYTVYLLWRPHIKQYYGVETPTSYAPQQTYPQPYTQPPPAQTQPAQPTQSGETPRCPVCGTPLVYVAQYNRWYCPKCNKYY
ncbi:MAG: hypothetical protein DRJ35_06405 [Thermoprotei archaeon]|nr:MAG: hypothetical protein DRJ35_06405 [Thermoprotei archaeon]